MTKHIPQIVTTLGSHRASTVPPIGRSKGMEMLYLIPFVWYL